MSRRVMALGGVALAMVLAAGGCGRVGPPRRSRPAAPPPAAAAAQPPALVLPAPAPAPASDPDAAREPDKESPE